MLHCTNKDKRLSLSIKLRIYLALVQSVLLYASETWTLTVADSKSLDAFHMKCQRRILGISWHQFVRNEEIAARTGLSRTPSEAWRRSTSSQGTPQLRQVVSGTPPRSYMETSSWSSTWQVNRPTPKRQQPPTCRSMEAGYQARSRWKSNATVSRLRNYLT